MEKPGIWFLLTQMCKKHLWRNEILSKDADHRASKNQLPVFYITRTMVANELNKTFPELQGKYCYRYKIYEIFLKEINRSNVCVLHPQNLLA